MRVVVQRVRNASVTVPEMDYKASVGNGLLLLAAFIDEDDDTDLEWTAKKIVGMRIFDDADGVMNLSVKDVDGINHHFSRLKFTHNIHPFPKMLRI